MPQKYLRSSLLRASSLPLRSLLRMNDNRLLKDELRFLRSAVCVQRTNRFTQWTMQ